MAVVRVKRRCDEEPIDALLLTCKRRKTEDDDVTSVFKLATTITDQEEDVSKHISKAFKSLDAKSTFKRPNISNITDKLRAETKLSSQNNRLKVVNCFRALSEADSLEDCGGPSDSSRAITIVDIESIPTLTSDTLNSSSELSTDIPTVKYVYDLYCDPECEIEDTTMLDDVIRIIDLDGLDLYSDICYENEEDSDDSNDENNWRNDYPDEDPDSIGEDQMKLACMLNGLSVCDANSLSSDDGEEAMVYGMDDPDYDYNVNYFGYDYAAFKKRVTEEDSDASDDSYNYVVSDISSNDDE